MQQFALVGGGRVSSCFVTKIVRLPLLLGPVAARSYRLASRIANQIAAGFPVRGFGDLRDHSHILIAVPPPQLETTVRLLASAFCWKGKTALLCGVADGSALTPLIQQGAWAGSMHPVPGFHLQRFIAEGSVAALRTAKALAQELGARIETVDSTRIATYAAVHSFSNGMFVPLLEAAMRSLLECGFHKAAAAAIVERQFQQAIRGYCYSGSKSWSGALATGDHDQVRRELQALEKASPRLGRFYRFAAASALELYGRHPELREALHPSEDAAA